MKIIETDSPPSPLLLRASALFGLAVRIRPCTRPRTPLLPSLLAAISRSRLTLITGPSGGGKSTLGNALAGHLRTRRRPVITASPPRRERRALIDSLSPTHALPSLAAAGLADATLLARPVATLSEGERARLSLARAIAAARALPPRRRVTLLIDEFASTLDRPTARCLCHTLARWARSPRNASRRVVCITAHDDVLEWLRPDALVFLSDQALLLERIRP